MPEILTPFILFIGISNVVVGLEKEPQYTWLVCTGAFLVGSIFMSEFLSVVHVMSGGQ